MLISCFSVFSYLLVFDSLNILWFFIFSYVYFLKSYLNYYDGFFLTDFNSFSLIFISLWVFIISLRSTKLDNTRKTVLWLIIRTIFTSFLYYNGFMFYLFFEFCFVLIFLFLIGWGIIIERVQASFYMFFYTLVFSLPFLILILEETLYSSINYFLMFYSPKTRFLWVFIILVFVVKLPLFGFHLWLPKAHVEAPVVGSIILAGVLLKLGGFGLIRFYSLVEFIRIKNNLIVIYLILIRILGGVIINCVCLRQTDLKIFIAYSSIVHIRLVYLRAISFRSTGHLGCLLIILAHGFVSPALFYLINLLYRNTYTRSLFSLKGNINLSPSFTLFWFIGVALNFGFPPFISFYREIIITMSLSFLNLFNILIIIIFFFLTGAYCIFMYISVTHGEPKFRNPLKITFLNKIINSVLFFFVLIYPLFFFNL